MKILIIPISHVNQPDLVIINWISGVSGQQVSLKSNTNSSQGLPQIGQLISRIIPDTSSQFLELTADNIDLMSINPIQYQRVFPARKDMLEKINLYKELGNGYTYLGFNLKKAPFNDVNVRQAINYAIDKDEVIKGVLLGLGEPIACLLYTSPSPRD